MYLGNHGSFNYYTTSFRREQGEDWARDDEAQVEESDRVVRTVVARKDRRAAGTGRQIRKGDTVRVATWFTFEVGGPRLRYFREETVVSRALNA